MMPLLNKQVKQDRTIIILLLLSILITMPSCKKDETPPLTPAKIISDELQNSILKNKVTRVVDLPLNSDWNNVFFSEDYGLDYEFDGEFIYIEGAHFNLNKLVKYEIRNRQSQIYMVLYFN
jgi:hypothetical protein